MSYSAFTGIEYLKDGKWNCLISNVPEELKKLHYGFGARNNWIPYVNVDDFDCGNRDFSPEINKEINGPFINVTHYEKKPDTETDKKNYFAIVDDATEEGWLKSLEEYVPNPKGGFDVTTVDNDFKYPVLGVTTFDKLATIRDRIFTEIKEHPHLYYTPKEALEEMLYHCVEGNDDIKRIIKDIFSHSELELREKGFLNNPYAADEYADLEYNFFAVQYALNLMQHYVEAYNAKCESFKDWIDVENCRLVMWGC